MLEFFLDGFDGLRHPLSRRYVVRSRVDRDTLALHQDFTSQRMDPINLLDFIAEEFNAGCLFVINGDHLNGVSLDSKVPPNKLNVVALILNCNQRTNQFISIDSLPNLERQRLSKVFLWSTKAIDARNGRHHNHISSREQRHRC